MNRLLLDAGKCRFPAVALYSVFTLVPYGVWFWIYNLLHFNSVFKGLNLAIHCDSGAGWCKCDEFRLLDFGLPCNS